MDSTWLYAGNSENPMVLINSKNPSGADNQQGSLRDPSETKRRASYWDEDIVRTLWRHKEVGRNDQPASL